MREVPVPTRPAAHPFHCIVIVAVWLIVLQAFLAGVAAASSAMPPPDATGALCHGAGDAKPVDAPGSNPRQEWHVCCASCLASAPAIPAPAAPTLCAPGGSVRIAAPPAITIMLARGARRAGQSQAPPGQV